MPAGIGAGRNGAVDEKGTRKGDNAKLKREDGAGGQTRLAVVCVCRSIGVDCGAWANRAQALFAERPSGESRTQ